MKYSKWVFRVVSILILCSGCRQKVEVFLDDAEIIHQAQKKLTQVIIYDVFTPPVASRIYAYTSLAAFEAIRFSKPGEPSLTEKMKGFSKMPSPEPGKEYDFTLAASHAFFTVSHKVIFSIDCPLIFTAVTEPLKSKGSKWMKRGRFSPPSHSPI